MADNMDVLQALGNAGLAAAGAGELGPVWDLFFPGGQAFSEEQIAQLTDLLQTILAQEFYEQYVINFIALQKDIGDYINNPNNNTLPNISTTAQTVVEGISALGGYGVTRAYVSAAALNILALRLQWNVAPDSSKAGAALNIANAAMDALTTLQSFE